MLMIATYTVVGIVCTAMLYLAIDVGALGILLYFAGGSANPFVSLASVRYSP